MAAGAVTSAVVVTTLLAPIVRSAVSVHPAATGATVPTVPTVRPDVREASAHRGARMAIGLSVASVRRGRAAPAGLRVAVGRGARTARHDRDRVDSAAVRRILDVVAQVPGGQIRAETAEAVLGRIVNPVSRGGSMRVRRALIVRTSRRFPRASTGSSSIVRRVRDCARSRRLTRNAWVSTW